MSYMQTVRDKARSNQPAICPAPDNVMRHKGACVLSQSCYVGL